MTYWEDGVEKELVWVQEKQTRHVTTYRDFNMYVSFGCLNNSWHVVVEGKKGTATTWMDTEEEAKVAACELANSLHRTYNLYYHKER